MVNVVSQTLQQQSADGLDALSASERAERLRFSMLGSGVASFDWTIADDRIGWDGAIDLLPYHHDAQRLPRGASFLAWLNPDSRTRLVAMIEMRSVQQGNFEMALEASSAMGSIGLTMLGIRQPRADGRTERLS